MWAYAMEWLQESTLHTIIAKFHNGEPSMNSVQS